MKMKEAFKALVAKYDKGHREYEHIVEFLSRYKGGDPAKVSAIRLTAGEIGYIEVETAVRDSEGKPLRYRDKNGDLHFVTEWSKARYLG